MTVGDYRIDVAGTHDGRPVFIEVAVTHAVDDTKRKALSRLGVHCFEIKLDPYQHESWTWTSLRQEILECIGNRDWIFHPDTADLAEQARREAIAKAFEKPIPAAAPERIRFRIFEVPVHVTHRTWGLSLWWPYNERVNPILKAIAKSHGGRYNPKYKNWVIPVSAKAALLEQLNGIGAIREN